MIKKLLRKVIYKEKYNSETYIKFLKKKGVRIGDRTWIVSPKDTYIDPTRPFLIEIGNDVVITAYVKILTHGYDYCVIRNKFNGEVYGSSGKVKIGNNVFVGMNTTILKGVEIGNNVIIGANSLVNKNIPDNVVVAGNPARIIMSIDEYREKRRREYIDEAKELVREYEKTYLKKVSMEQLYEFYPIMLERSRINEFNFGNLKYEEARENFLSTEPIYNGLDDFLNSCNEE